MFAVTQYLKNSIGPGMCVGTFSFVAMTTIHKLCLLGNVRFQEIRDEDYIPISQRFARHFWKEIIIIPIVEESCCRPFQHLCTQAFLWCNPASTALFYANIPQANALSAAGISLLLGACEEKTYTSGKQPMAVMHTIRHLCYGLIYEKYGLAASICANITHTFITGWFYKYYPTFLANPKDDKQPSVALPRF